MNSKMNNYDYTIYNYLARKLNVVKRSTSGDETVIRCPFCGDSKKSKFSAHLYIKNEAPFKYYCQKCNNFGIVNDKFLMRLDAYEVGFVNEISMAQTKYQMNMNKKYGVNSFLKINQDDIIYKPNQVGELEQRKLDYISNRLGIKFTVDDVDKYKIVLNLKDFYENNKIDFSKLSDKRLYFLDKLNENYISFLLYDTSMLACRNINDNVDKKEKFYKLKLYENIDDSKRFYSIRNDIDLNNRVFNIYMAEGIFDIISIYNNLVEDKNANNNLFMANNGKGYAFILNYLASMGLLNNNINIYCDNDVKIKDLMRMLKNCTNAKVNGINVYYNIYNGNGVEGNKRDFGVNKEFIISSDKNVIEFL